MTDRPIGSLELRQRLAHAVNDITHLRAVLPEAHRRYRRPNGDADGLRSISPSGSSRGSDVADPTARTALSNIAMEDSSPNITPATPDDVTIMHVLRLVLIVSDRAREAVRALACIDASLAVPLLPRCHTCALVITEATPATDAEHKPQCDACHRRLTRHTRQAS